MTPYFLSADTTPFFRFSDSQNTLFKSEKYLQLATMELTVYFHMTINSKFEEQQYKDCKLVLYE